MAGAMSVLLFGIANLVPVLAAPLRDFSAYSFETYLKEFGKAYAEGEMAKREEIFNKNLKMVQSHNEEHASGVHTWWMEMNEFADWTPEELAVLHSGHKKMMPSGADVAYELLQENRANPESIDWREKSAVTPVKDQGGCGSCWAFSAIESVESHYAIATGKLVKLAPQAYVDCVKNPQQCGGTGGCEGATMELAFNLTRDMGVPLESTLPYKGKDEECSAYTPAVKATGYVKLPVNNAQALETALATKGPVSVTVAASPWFLYGGGVFSGCSDRTSGATLDHGVQAVGYSKDYWIVRNSWGPSWGESGFIRLSRASDGKTFKDTKPAEGVACKPYPKEQIVGGECGVLFDTAYPTGVQAADMTVDKDFVVV